MSNKVTGGLGKGLNALFQSIKDESEEKDLIANYEKNIKKEENLKNKIINIKLSEIEPNKEQARKNFDNEKLQELAKSIKKFGVIQPILVVKEGEFYKIVAGERRWRASKIAEKKDIPAIILENKDQANKEISLIENLHRTNLNPIERAKAYKNFIDEYSMSIDEFSQAISKSTSSIRETLKYLELDERVIEFALEGKISESLLKALSKIEEKDLQYEVALYVIEDGLELEEALKRLRIRKKSLKKDKQEYKEIFSEIRSIENKLSQVFGSKTKIVINKKTPEKGKIVLSYSSHEDLERLINLLENK